MPGISLVFKAFLSMQCTIAVHKKRSRTKKICGVDELLGNLEELELRSIAKRTTTTSMMNLMRSLRLIRYR